MAHWPRDALSAGPQAALECAHRGWGMSCVIGVAASGKEISTRCVARDSNSGHHLLLPPAK